MGHRIAVSIFAIVIATFSFITAAAATTSGALEIVKFKEAPVLLAQEFSVQDGEIKEAESKSEEQTKAEVEKTEESKPVEKQEAEEETAEETVDSEDESEDDGKNLVNPNIEIRKLADKLAEGLKKQGADPRYTQVAVINFGESGEEAKKRELGLYVSAKLAAFLKTDHDFILVERNKIQEVLKEQEKAQYGIIDEDEAVQVGKVLQAQALVTGSVNEAGANFEITARIVSTESGSVITTAGVTIPSDDLIALSSDAVIFRSKGGAAARSLLLPGWGQFYSRQYIAGAVATTTIVALLGASLTFHILGKVDENKYKEDTQNTIDYAEKAESKYGYRNMFLYVTAAAWVVNVIEAYIAGPESKGAAGDIANEKTDSEVKFNFGPSPSLSLSW